MGRDYQVMTKLTVGELVNIPLNIEIRQDDMGSIKADNGQILPFILNENDQIIDQYDLTISHFFANISNNIDPAEIFKTIYQNIDGVVILDDDQFHDLALAKTDEEKTIVVNQARDRWLHGIIPERPVYTPPTTIDPNDPYSPF